EQLADDLLALRRLERTHLTMDHPSFPRNDHGERQGHQFVAQRLRELHRPQPPDECRIVEPDLFGELPDFVCLIDGDADKLDAFSAFGVLKANEFAHLVAAWRAPRCPEINDEDLPSPLIEALLPPFG